MAGRKAEREPGLVVTRMARQTGREVSIYYSPEADGDESPWETVCEDHGCVVTHPSLRLAERHSSDPLGWCEACADLRDGKCRDCGKPPKAGNESSPGVTCTTCDIYHQDVARTGPKLSAAQEQFMATVRAAGDAGYETPPFGQRDSGRAASAWYRTAGALERRGLITLERVGDHKRARLRHDNVKENNR